MTLIGAFLTALVMARANGSAARSEALFVTPVRPVEVLLAKIIPYFAVGMMGLGAVPCWPRCFLFAVPMYGSMVGAGGGARCSTCVVSVGIGLRDIRGDAQPVSGQPGGADPGQLPARR